jgi:hypothetical protein
MLPFAARVSKTTVFPVKRTASAVNAIKGMKPEPDAFRQSLQ